jgi:excisionase family DNA binding protein
MPKGIVTRADARYLTLTEAAAIVGVSLPTIRRRIDSGHLVGYETLRDRRATLVRAADLERLTQTRREGAPVAST